MSEFWISSLFFFKDCDLLPLEVSIMLIPSGSTFYGNEANVSTFTLTGHTDEKPRMVVVRRTPRNTAGNSGMSVKVVRGVSQPDGSIRNLIVEVTVRNVPAQVIGDVNAANDALRSILQSSGFDSDCFKLQLPFAAQIAV